MNSHKLWYASEMAKFSLGYLFSSSYRKKAEYVTDSYAITTGLSDYTLATKDYILNNA